MRNPLNTLFGRMALLSAAVLFAIQAGWFVLVVMQPPRHEIDGFARGILLVLQAINGEPMKGAEADPSVSLPKATDVPDQTPTETQTPETYLGYQYAPLHVSGSQPAQDATQHLTFPAKLNTNTFALDGTWTADSEELAAGPGAKLELNFQADDVYLVMGGKGTVGVRLNGQLIKSVSVNGVPKLYTLISGTKSSHGVLTLDMSPGVQAYDFTFG